MLGSGVVRVYFCCVFYFSGCSLPWKHSVLITGPPGKSQVGVNLTPPSLESEEERSMVQLRPAP